MGIAAKMQLKVLTVKGFVIILATLPETLFYVWGTFVVHYPIKDIYEPRHEKTCFLHMCKQSSRSAER